MRALVVVALAGCGFSSRGAAPDDGAHGDGRATDGRDVDGRVTDGRLIDAPAIDAGPDCWAQWFSGAPSITSVTSLNGPNTTGSERDPFLTDDEQTLYFSRGPATGNANDTYVAHVNPGGHWMNIAKVTNLSSAADDGKVTMTQDGTFAAFASEQSGPLVIWGATRDPGTGAVDPPSMTPFTTLDLSPNLFDPSFNEDGSHLYLAPLVAGQQHIAMSTRTAGVYGAFSETHLGALVAGGTAADPHIADHELVILFSSRRAGDSDLYYATRATATSDFGSPIQIPSPTLNTIADEGDPHLSSDGCRLYFSRDVNGRGDYDLLVATVGP